MTAQQNHTVLWNTLIVKDIVTTQDGKPLIPDVPLAVNRIADTMMSNEYRYQLVSGRFANPIRWYHIAVIHYLECSLNFNRYLGNGQSLYRKTTIVPKGRGPFNNFEDGAIDAIKLTGLHKVEDWSIGNTLYILEGYNGYGYRQYHNTNSPYLYSGSNHYAKGKYVSDGRYDANAVSGQIGAALLLKTIEKRLNITL